VITEQTASKHVNKNTVTVSRWRNQCALGSGKFLENSCRRVCRTTTLIKWLQVTHVKKTVILIIYCIQHGRSNVSCAVKRRRQTGLHRIGAYVGTTQAEQYSATLCPAVSTPAALLLLGIVLYIIIERSSIELPEKPVRRRRDY